MKNERKNEMMYVTKLGFVINIFLTILKFIAGIFGRSSAMIADAIHSSSDMVSDVVVLVFVHFSNKPKDENHNYGHGKFETFASFSIGLILFFVGIGMLYSAVFLIVEILQGTIVPQPGFIALVGALISIIAKEYIFWKTIRVGKKHKSDAIIANAWHHRSDALSSIAALIGISGAYFLGEGFIILDPIAAVLVSIFIIKVAYEIIKPAYQELLDQSLPAETENRIIEIISHVEHVVLPHSLKTRKIGSDIAIETHIYLPDEFTIDKSHDITEIIDQNLKTEFGENTQVSIHVEPISLSLKDDSLTE